MALAYTVRPISDRTWLRPPGDRRRAQFTASWSDTLDLLQREYEYLGGHHLVIEIDLREQDLRVDGTLRANARPEESPAVVVAFQSQHGPLLYRSDLYGSSAYAVEKKQRPWQANVRAVALTLEALRAVDRYGATRRAEQYQGFRALPPGTGVEPTGMTVEVALRVLKDEAHAPLVTGLRDLLRTAQANAHPDRNNGDRSRWDAVDQAEQVLRRAGRL
jgi:hypothetical protein